MSAGAIIPSDIRAGPIGEGSAKPQAGAATAPAGVPGATVASGGEAPPKAAFFSRNALSAGELFKQTAAALKLPVDTLSVTLLAFSRFFSLTPSQALITALRRDVLSSSSSSPQTAAEKAALEAKAMAAAAAADKGVALSPEALERYARFLDPPAFAEDGEPGGKDAFDGGGDGKKNQKNREDAPDKEELRAIAEEEAKKDGLLDFLNSIPGKNGQYWIVYPFCINVRGIELKIFVRILEREPFLTCQNEQLLVDIVSPKRQYRCFLKKSSGRLQADIRVYPEVSPKALKLLSKNAERFLGNVEFEDILVRNGEGAPSWAEAWLAEYLPYIDKEV